MTLYVKGKNNSSLPSIEWFGYSDDCCITQNSKGKRGKYIIHFVIKGSGHFNGNPVTAGQGFLITPNTEIELYHYDENNPWSFMWFVSSDSVLEQLVEKFKPDESTGIFDYPSVIPLKQEIDFLKSNNSKTVPSEILLENFLHIINQKKEYQAQSAKYYYHLAKELIRKNLSKPITVEEITDSLGISQPYLYKIFVSNMGISPKQAIDKIRLDASEDLLTISNYSISQISEMLGFCDAHAFSKAFKKYKGKSPRDYRKVK